MNCARPHIGMVTASLSTRSGGGVYQAMLGQSLALVGAGAAVSWFGPMRPVAPEPFEGEAIRIVPCRLVGPRRFAFSTNLLEKITMEGPDLLHLHGLWLPPSQAVLRWGQITRKPVIISPHGMLDPWAKANSSWKKFLALAVFERANLDNAACLHALNSAEAEAIRANGFTKPVAIIPNGISTYPMESVERAEGPRELLFLGRLHPKKGLDETIRAWHLLGERAPEVRKGWQLVIAGWDDAGYQSSLRNLVAELGIGSCVRFAGPLFNWDKELAFQRASAFILASHSEGQPMAVLEAWSHGLPVLMTKNCNLPEGFTAGAAIKVETDPILLSKALADTLRSPNLPEIGKRGARLVASRFRWNAAASDHLAVYEWLLGKAPRPGCVELT